MKTKELLTAAAAAVAVYLIARQLIARKATADRYNVAAGSTQADMLQAQDEGLLW